MSESIAAAPAAPAPSSPESQVSEVAQDEGLPEPEVVAAPPKAPEPKRYKVKVDGEEQDLSEEELIQHAQLGKAAHKRMQESAQLRKDMESFVKMLKENPSKILSDPRIGVDVKKFAQDIINKEIEDMQKSPEQIEKEKLQAELSELKDKYKQDEDNRKKEEFERLQTQAEQQLDTDITSALDNSGLPKTPYTVKKMAEIMMVALQNNVDLTAKDVIPLLQKTIKSEIREMMASSPEDLIEELIGKENISKLRKRNIQRMKEAVPTVKDVKETGESSKNKEETGPKKKISMKDFFNM